MPIEVLRRLWERTGASSASRPEDRTYKEPPKPSGDWGLIVDKFGDPVIGREPDGTDFLARYPIEYDYRGTTPPYNPNDYQTPQERIAATMDYAERDHRNKALLDKAVFLLSQTDDGRRLLQMAKQEKFHFVFDQERMEKEGALGMCDYSKKQIPLAEGRSAEEVALTLKHELQHMDDGTGQNAFSYNHTHTLTSSLMADRALEANARVSEAIACVESLNGNSRGPERQFRTSALFNNFFQKNTPMADIAQTNLGLATEGKWPTFARRVFDGYFKQTGTLDYYDQRQADMRTKLLYVDPEKAFDRERPEYEAIRKHFGTKERLITHIQGKLAGVAENDHWTHNQDDLKNRVTIRGHQTYLNGKDSPDLTSAKYAGFGDKAKEALASFVNRAKTFIPDKIDQVETALIAPTRKIAIPKPVLSPYASKTKADDFEIIRHPNRHDHKGYEVAVGSPGQSSRSRTTELFAKSYSDYSQNHTELDATSLAIQYMYSNQNIRGAVRDLVDCGFRAPIAAFPDSFIIDMCQSIDYMQRTGNMPDFKDYEFTLLNHWRELAERGHDPVYGSEELKKEDPFLFEQEAEPYFNSYLKPYFDKLEAEHGHKRVSSAQPTSAA